MIIYKQWGTNDFGYPIERPKEINRNFTGNIIPTGWLETTEELLDSLLISTEEQALTVTNNIREQQRLSSTYVMNGLTYVDTTLDYTILLSRNDTYFELVEVNTGTQEDPVLVNRKAVVTTYTKNEILALKEFKIYEYNVLTDYPKTETLKIEYYNLNNEVINTKIVLTELCLSDSKKAQARINNAKINNIEKLIINQKIITSNPISISKLNMIANTETLSFTSNNLIDPLLNVFNNFNTHISNTSFSQVDKDNIILLFDNDLLTSIISILES